MNGGGEQSDGWRDRRSLRVVVTTALKLAAAGAVICLIAFSIAVLDRDATVTESQADIFDLGFGQKPNQVRFHEALDSMGHPEPQVFDLNGNTVHFSVNYSRHQPDDLVRRYQEEFVARGLNDRVYSSVADAARSDGLETRLTGGITPVDVTDSRIVMGGMLTDNIALETEDLKSELIARDDLELFRGHRWIEIFRPPGAEQTTVLASWSDDDFSYEKMFASDERTAQGRSVDPDVPSCPGCQRVNHFADREDPRGYRSNIFITSRDTRHMANFYRRAMTQRGWSETEFQDAYETVRQSVNYSGDAMKKLRFEDDPRLLEIFIYPLDDREIAVQTVLWEQLD